jgi:hypothetical protein
MKTLRAALLLAVLTGTSSCSVAYPSADPAGSDQLRHVVAFRFKPGVTPEQMQQVTEDFHALKQKVPQIIEFEGGPDIHLQRKAGKFTHVFIVTVRNEEDLAAYGAHPDHRAFSRSADPLLAEVMVVDYWNE